MKDVTNHYAYRIRWSAEDGEYVGTCAEFPGLSWLDDSPADALVGIQRVAREAVADMRVNGENPPEPYADRTYSGRFLVRIPPEEHRKLAVEAAEQGISLNRLAANRLANA
ncbi:antitoxin HicB [Bifidobacterium margollesii]|uniref:Antitoxin HicB n=1 Tax=Bifidobacterium margollesii TaxID=2020964 RepID=A0A2N5J707_9BIFI|nr:type II toxin-antitoxin system HicB family antitoxin [Bifidobacterium margollesii]PLS29983.1 antitoxin HicB [Bifidobacterium margollesii]